MADFYAWVQFEGEEKATKQVMYEEDYNNLVNGKPARFRTDILSPDVIKVAEKIINGDLVYIVKKIKSA